MAEGCIETSCTPLQQLPGSYTPCALHRAGRGSLLRVCSAEGMRGLYRGFTVAFMGSAPAACLYFTTYEKSKRALEELPQLRHGAFAGHFMAGLVAETVR